MSWLTTLTSVIAGSAALLTISTILSELVRRLLRGNPQLKIEIEGEPVKVSTNNYIEVASRVQRMLSSPARAVIIYSHSDKKFVSRLVKDLRANKIETWWDDDGIRVGESIPAMVEKALTRSHYVIVVVPTEGKSPAMEKELAIAIQHETEHGGAAILPVVIGKESIIPELISDRLYANFSNDYEKAMKQILERIASDRPKFKHSLGGAEVELDAVPDVEG